MKRLLSIMLVLACAGIAQAQVPFFAPRASTELESYLNGLARLRSGTGEFFNHYGDFLIEREQARELNIENWEEGVRAWWDVKDDWAERNRNTYLENRAKRIAALTEDAELRKEEDDLITKGILPPKPESCFIVDGVRCRSIAEWKASDVYQEMLKRQYLKEMADQVAKEEGVRRAHSATMSMAMWDKMGMIERQNYSRMSRLERAEYMKEYYDRDYMDAKLKERADARFRKIRPYLNP